MTIPYLFFLTSAIINLIVSFILGFVILLKSNKNYANITFSIFSFCVSAWSFLYIFWPLANTKNETLLWFQLLHIPACFISILYFQFVILWLNLFKQKRIYLYFGYLFAIFLVFSIPTKLFIRDITPKFQMKFWAEPGLLYYLYISVFIFYFIYSSYLLYKNYKVNFGAKKFQIKYILIGMIIGFLGGSTNYFLWFDINIPPYGNILVSSFVIFTSYAIIKYRFIDIRIIARRLFVYLGLSIFAYGFYTFLVYTYTLVFGSVYNVNTLYAGIFMGPLFAICFYAFDSFLTRFANTYFFSSLHNYEKDLNKLTYELSHYTDLNKIIDSIVDTMLKSLKLNRAGILIANFNFSPVKYQIAKVIGFDITNGIHLVEESFFTQYLLKTSKPLVTDELELIANACKKNADKENFLRLKKEMIHIEASLCLPLISNKKLIGMIVLGAKTSGDAYTKQDLEILETMAYQASIAIDNARLYKNSKEFNRTLQKKVDEQTSEIRAKAEKLEKLLKMRTEFLDIASHQLKTPVSVIRGTISMFQEGSMDKLPPEEQKKFINNIAQKAEKLNFIISDILRASELDTDEFAIKESSGRPSQLEDLVEAAYQDVFEEAKSKGLELILNKPKNKTTPIITSPDFLEQAFYNLLNNAVKYTEKGFVKISLKEENNDRIVTVEDSGIGIPADDQKKMFEKFARAKNAVNMYADGSGLGLFIIKKIVEAHPGGRVEFQSQEGKGTIFTIILPIISAKAVNKKTAVKAAV